MSAASQNTVENNVIIAFDNPHIGPNEVEPYVRAGKRMFGVKGEGRSLLEIHGMIETIRTCEQQLSCTLQIVFDLPASTFTDTAHANTLTLHPQGTRLLILSRALEIDFVNISGVQHAQILHTLVTSMRWLNSNASILATVSCLDGLKAIEEIVRLVDGMIITSDDFSGYADRSAELQRVVLHHCMQQLKPFYVSVPAR